MYKFLTERLNLILEDNGQEYKKLRKEGNIITSEIHNLVKDWKEKILKEHKIVVKTKYDDVIVFYLKQQYNIDSILRILEGVIIGQIDIFVAGTNKLTAYYKKLENIESAVILQNKKNQRKEYKNFSFKKSKGDEVEGAVLIHTTDDNIPYDVYKVTNPQGLYKLGENTTWCVRLSNYTYACNYGKESNFYIFYNKEIEKNFQEVFGLPSEINGNELCKMIHKNGFDVYNSFQYSYKFAVLLKQGGIEQVFDISDTDIYKYNIARERFNEYKSKLNTKMVYNDDLLNNFIHYDIKFIFGKNVISKNYIDHQDITLNDILKITDGFLHNIESDINMNHYRIRNIFSDIEVDYTKSNYNNILQDMFKYVETISGNISINTDNVNEFFNIIFDKKDIFSESIYIKNGKTSKVDLSNIREIDKNLYINSVFIKEITGLPEIINGDLSLSMCSITSLPVMPDRITNLYLDGTKITNTDNICAKSVDNLYIRNIRNLNITELPQQINGNIYIRGTKLSNESMNKLSKIVNNDLKRIINK